MYIDILILSQLLKKPRHGYEIKQNIENVLGHSIDINNNMLYPALKRFEDLGLVKKNVVVQDGKPNRCMYRITRLGKEDLLNRVREFTPCLASHKNEFYSRFIFFKMLPLQERRKILSLRRSVQKRRLEYLKKIDLSKLKTKEKYIALLIEFEYKQITNEIEWLETLEKIS